MKVCEYFCLHNFEKEKKEENSLDSRWYSGVGNIGIELDLIKEEHENKKWNGNTRREKRKKSERQEKNDIEGIGKNIFLSFFKRKSFDDLSFYIQLFQRESIFYFHSLCQFYIKRKETLLMML